MGATMNRFISVIAACAIVATSSLGQTPTPAPSVCIGDCNGKGQVTVDELLLLVWNALNGGTEGCPDAAAWCSPTSPSGVQVDCILEAVNNALNGCPMFPSDGACMVATTSCNTATAYSVQVIPTRRACCQWWGIYAGPGTIYWCPAESFDPATGRCTACTDPCTGSPCNSQTDCAVGFTCTDSRCCPTAPPGSCFPTPVVP